MNGEIKPNLDDPASPAAIPPRHIGLVFLKGSRVPDFIVTPDIDDEDSYELVKAATMRKFIDNAPNSESWDVYETTITPATERHRYEGPGAEAANAEQPSI